HDLEQEETPLRFAFLLLDLSRRIFRLELLRSCLVAALHGREIAEQLTDGGIGQVPRRPLVEALTFGLHQLGLARTFSRSSGRSSPIDLRSRRPLLAQLCRTVRRGQGPRCKLKRPFLECTRPFSGVPVAWIG